MFLRQFWRYTYNYSTCCVLVKNFIKSHINLQCKKLEVVYTQFHNLSNSCFEINQNRKFSEINTSNTSFDEENDVGIWDEQNTDTDDGNFCVKTLLYPKPHDVLLQNLNDCSNAAELFEIYKDHKEQLKVNHMVQMVILLWNCWKDIPPSTLQSYDEFLNYLNNFVDKMNADECTCSFLYLCKIGVSTNHPTIQNLILKARDIISTGRDVPLSALSRFTVGVNMKNDIYTLLVCKDVMRIVVNRLETCTTIEELRLITICLHNLVLLVSKDTLERYRNKVSDLIKSGEINNTSSRHIFKVLNFLTYPHWIHDNAQLIRDLLLIIEDEIASFSAQELEVVLRVFQSQLEPAFFTSKLLKSAEDLYQRNPTLELFSYIVQLSQTHKREDFTNAAKKMFCEQQWSIAEDLFPKYFKILRSLKISDEQICNAYWSKVLNHILHNPTEREIFKLLKHCHRYMHFNNNLGGTYRHYGFEKAISSLLMTELTEGVSSVIPSKFSRLSSFVLAYGHTHNSHKKFPDYIVSKIENMGNQFNIFDCLFLSRGIQIALKLRFRKDVPPALATQLVQLENVLNNCAERHLNENLTLGEINLIVRSLNNRKCSRKAPLYEKVLDKYKHVSDDLNSRLIRDVMFNLNSSNYVIPEIIEKIWRYVVENRNYIMGDTVQKILNCSYNLGVMAGTEDALHWSAEIIKRDFDFMSGLSIIQACLALCWYKALPEGLINKVFCIDFIKRLEDEIQLCYSKATYPERVLNQVMQLNRAVCLDYPECRVPWFQQNYIEAQLAKKPVVQSRFHADVKSLLVSIVKDEKFLRCNHITPYGYIVDFVIHLDKNKKLITPPEETAAIDKITKVAILPLRMESYCENNSKNIRGPEYLRMRHLEILGYKVIHINFIDWNAMYMNVPGVKVNYLKNLLQIN